VIGRSKFYFFADPRAVSPTQFGQEKICSGRRLSILHDREYSRSWHGHGQYGNGPKIQFQKLQKELQTGQYGNGPKIPFQKLQKELQIIFGNLVRHVQQYYKNTFIFYKQNT
jgi:hypothetical protein